jgi:tripeptidyl-peptidase I
MSLHALRRAGLALMALTTALPAALAAVTVAQAPPQSWTPTGKLTPDDTISLTLVLSMQQIENLESMLLSVSTPGSPHYGQYLDSDAVRSTFAPSSDSVNAVTSWLKGAGVKNFKVDGFFVDLSTTISTANNLLAASYQHYTSNGQSKVRTQSYTLPDAVSRHIQLVDPGVYFGGSLKPDVAVRVPSTGTDQPPVERRATSTSKSPTSTVSLAAACTTSLSASCIKQLYSVGSYSASASSGSRIGVGNFLNQSAIYADLFQYEQVNGIPQQNVSSVIYIANGTNDQNSFNYLEGNLDLQNIVGMSHPLPVTAYFTGGSPPFVPNIDQPTAADNGNEPYVPYYRYLVSQSNKTRPQVISNSYNDEEDGVPFDYATTVCNLIGMLGMSGVTVLHSSGDFGVGAGCLAPDNKTVETNAIFPASCPYVTSVGGTQGIQPETAWSGSGGGFSKYFARPSYQDSAVTTYLNGLSSATKSYYGHYTNFSGRGFPDVSAQAYGRPFEQIIYGGQPGAGTGTSAAAPVWAGIIALLNDARLRAGKPVLGFLNPLLYTGGSALNDIVSGHSTGCNGVNPMTGLPEPQGAGIIPWAAWNATVGWDPVTGLGTPNFGKLRTLVGA